MTPLPDDLIAKIDELHDDPTERLGVRDALEELWDGGINVGPAQLARAIVFLADGNIDRFRELRTSFLGDPRDLLVHANSFLQKSNYWFAEPFSKMGPRASPNRPQTD